MAADTINLADALVGNRGFLEPLIGFEPVTRAARLCLAQYINDEIDAQSEKWASEDLALQALGFDPGVGQIEVEHISSEHLHEGPHLSLLRADIEAFPNCSVMAYQVSPSGEQFDQFDNVDLVLFAETMVIAGPVTAGQEVAWETIVHRRIQRTTEAVNASILRDRTLMGTVTPIQSIPRGGVNNSSELKPKEGGKGPKYLWQGSRLQYAIQRQAHFS